ncbi:hypothetical protein [Nocardioides jensenii]|uniref:hypothetical protein n=1 Tax=Nocardioides jensenii TaxID=1843 RepID=UPI000ADE2077|nr:hypothetical protein [Nocardioides jensenii]
MTVIVSAMFGAGASVAVLVWGGSSLVDQPERPSTDAVETPNPELARVIAGAIVNLGSRIDSLEQLDWVLVDGYECANQGVARGVVVASDPTFASISPSTTLCVRPK